MSADRVFVHEVRTQKQERLCLRHEEADSQVSVVKCHVTILIIVTEEHRESQRAVLFFSKSRRLAFLPC